METVLLKKIVPDKEQPRRYFDATKMRQLIESIKKEGIIQPLIVEKVGENYLLIDGERRFRAATELSLKEVPVVVEEPRSGVDRLVRQFTVQEQHEAWTPTEKANAIVKLSEEVGLSLSETCRLLNVGPGDTRRYVAFAEVVDKEAWVRSEMPLNMAEMMKSVRNTARRVTEQALKKEFTRNDEKRLEHRIIASFIDGSIKRRADVTKLIDSITKDPKALPKFMGDNKLTVQKLFMDVGAQGSNALRNVNYNCRYIVSHGRKFLEQPDVRITETQVKIMKDAKAILTKLIEMAE